MMKAMSHAAAMAALLYATAAAAETVSFKRDIVPVLKTRCATCHMTGKEAGNIALHPGAAYANLVGVKSTETNHLRVKSGAPAASYLMMKLDGTHLDAGGKGTRMPLGAPQLDAATRQRIRTWIAEGAKNN